MATWKTGSIKDGYRRICVNGKPNIYEHRQIMEEHMNRKLNPNEAVHHINGNRLDNRLENLIVMTKSSHTTMHQEELNKDRIIPSKTCQKCGELFYRKPRLHTRFRKQKYCSKKCADSSCKPREGSIRIPKICKYCGNSFVRTYSHFKNQIYCSRNCRILDKSIINTI